jgi:hypothetical protein
MADTYYDDRFAKLMAQVTNWQAIKKLDMDLDRLRQLCEAQ